VKTSPSEGSLSWKSGGKKDSIQNGGMKSLNNDDSWDIENRNDSKVIVCATQIVLIYKSWYNSCTCAALFMT
jgi:hypothetical protein